LGGWGVTSGFLEGGGVVTGGEFQLRISNYELQDLRGLRSLRGLMSTRALKSVRGFKGFKGFEVFKGV
jgi:hypothetical protein